MVITGCCCCCCSTSTASVTCSQPWAWLRRRSEQLFSHYSSRCLSLLLSISLPLLLLCVAYLSLHWFSTVSPFAVYLCQVTGHCISAFCKIWIASSHKVKYAHYNQRKSRNCYCLNNSCSVISSMIMIMINVIIWAKLTVNWSVLYSIFHQAFLHILWIISNNQTNRKQPKNRTRF